MQIYSFRKETGKEIGQFASQQFILTRIMASDQLESLHIACAHLGQQGKIGRHQAVGDQLLLIVDGTGWVSGEDAVDVEVTAGDAVYWQSGEWHETHTDSGLSAIMLESDSLAPALFMTAKP